MSDKTPIQVPIHPWQIVPFSRKKEEKQSPKKEENSDGAI